MKKIIPFVYRNFKYYLVVDESTAAILDQSQEIVSKTPLQHFAQSADPLVKFAFGIYQALVR